MNTQDNQMITYQANDEVVELSPSMVTQFVTKGNGNLTPAEVFNFMKLCQYQHLNPFIGEVYLVKYGSQPAQQIVSKEALLKRANRQATYSGMESGIVVLDADNKIVHKPGQTIYPNETLIAGWARVYRKDREIPAYVETGLTEYSKGQATWKNMPATMIRKVAQVNALREAFPEELAQMYIDEDAAAVSAPATTAQPTPQPKATSSDTTSSLEEKFKTMKQAEAVPEAEEEPKEAPKAQESVTSEAEEEPTEEEEAETKPKAQESSVDWSRYTMDQIKASLDKHGVAYPANARKAELVKIATDYRDGVTKSDGTQQNVVAVQDEPEPIVQSGFFDGGMGAFYESK